MELHLVGPSDRPYRLGSSLFRANQGAHRLPLFISVFRPSIADLDTFCSAQQSPMGVHLFVCYYEWKRHDV